MQRDRSFRCVMSVADKLLFNSSSLSSREVVVRNNVKRVAWSRSRDRNRSNSNAHRSESNVRAHHRPSVLPDR